MQALCVKAQGAFYVQVYGMSQAQVRARMPKLEQRMEQLSNARERLVCTATSLI